MSKPRGEIRYRKRFVKAAEKLCSQGADISVIAARCGVAKQTIYKWMKKHPDFKQAIVKGKDHYNTIVAEQKLIELVSGYSYDEVKEVTNWPSAEEKAKGDQGKRRTEVTTKRVQPNVTALIFYLKNRDPDRWRDVKSVEFTDPAEFEKRLRDAKKRLQTQLEKTGKVTTIKKSVASAASA